MANEAERVLAEALSLPSKARAELAGRLLESLHEEETDEDADSTWRDEIERRALEVKRGDVELQDWATVRRELEARRSKR